MNPSTIINKLAEEITLENVLKTIGSDNKDPLQPIMDIVHSSVIRYDYSTLTECFNIMDYKLNEILEIKSLNKEKKEAILNLVISHYGRAGILIENKKKLFL